MVRLTCLLRRKAGLTPSEFHEHWRTVHGPLIAASSSGKYVLRYEQHPRPLSDYRGDDDPGLRGVEGHRRDTSADAAALSGSIAFTSTD